MNYYRSYQGYDFNEDNNFHTASENFSSMDASFLENFLSQPLTLLTKVRRASAHKQ
jgi:hypothetical protein